MTPISDETVYRVATRDDETNILALFKEVAPEIPISLDDPEVEAKMITEIVQCRGETWVAVDANGKVIGFALARPDLRAKDTATSLKYIGVGGNSRGLGISSNLVNKLKAKGVPLTANVLSGNQSAMPDRLVRFGFTKVESDDKQTKFRWDCQNSAQADKAR
jgi:N-acetylglutamate synthase-like GNAT family acetyltransferase